MSPEVIVEGLRKKYCIVNKRYGRKDEGEIENVGSKHESVSRERDMIETAKALNLRMANRIKLATLQKCSLVRNSLASEIIFHSDNNDSTPKSV